MPDGAFEQLPGQRDPALGVEEALVEPQADLEAGAEDRRRLASLCCERAVSVLHQALALVAEGERVHFWQQKVLPDTALDAIRGSAGFKELSGKYPQK